MSFSVIPVPLQKTLFFVFVCCFHHSSAVSDGVGNSESFLRSFLVWFFTLSAACVSQGFSGSFSWVLFRCWFTLFKIGWACLSPVGCLLAGTALLPLTVTFLLLGFQMSMSSESYGYWLMLLTLAWRAVSLVAGYFFCGFRSLLVQLSLVDTLAFRLRWVVLQLWV